MSTGTKICPKCSKAMGVAENVLTIPAKTITPDDPISAKMGLAVSAFCCLGCDYVELYRQK